MSLPILTFVAVTWLAVLSGSAPAQDAASSSQDAALRAVAQEKMLVMAGPGSTYGEALQEALRKFFDPIGVKVTYVSGLTGANFTKAAQQAATGNPEIDLLIARDDLGPIGYAQKVFQPLDPKLVPNASQLAAFARPADTHGPYQTGSLIGLVYNKVALARAGLPAPTSWADVYSTEYSKCGIVWQTMDTGPAQRVMATINALASKGDPAAIDSGLPLLKAVAPTVKVVSGTDPDVVASVLEGTQSCIGYSQQSYVLAAISKSGGAEGSPLAFVVPKEGGAFLTVSIEIVRGTKRPAAASLAINHLLSAEGTLPLVMKQFLSPTNQQFVMPKSSPHDQIISGDRLTQLAIPIPLASFAKAPEWARKYNAMLSR